MKMEKKTIKGFKFSERGLIEKILRTTGMMDCNRKGTPTNGTKALGSDCNGESAKEKWLYGSVIGMMLYLAGNSRPDISFAVHQCARFTHTPKVSHENAILRICRYLKGTSEDGLIYLPDKSKLSLDCFVDADFC